MRINSIVNRYLLWEMLPPFLLNLVFFAFIFLMARLLDLVDLMVNHGVAPSSLLRLVFYSLPSFLEYVVPMSIMMGVLLAFLRLSSDNEIIALKVSGVSTYKLLLPVFAFSCFGVVTTAFIAMYGAPWGNLSSRLLLLSTAASNADIGLKERTFNDSFDGIMFYVSEIDEKNKTLTDVFLEDSRNPEMVSIVVAPKGRLLFSPESLSFRLTLFNGTINQVSPEEENVHSLGFDTYDFNLELAHILSTQEGKEKGRKELGLLELRKAIGEGRLKETAHAIVMMDYYKKFSIPFACLFLGLAAVPLGIQSKLSKRSHGMVMGFLFFLIYYVLLSAGWILGEGGRLPPAAAVWSPNVIIGGIGLGLLILCAKERSLGVAALLRLGS